MSKAKERPIIFKPDMVKAMLCGAKTQTRRLVKPNDDGRFSYRGEERHVSDPEATKACRYGLPGDRLWVRETFYNSRGDDSMPTYYKADQDTLMPVDFGYHQGPWSPSIYMPRWASRITLEVVSVRIARLHDITEEDAEAEGVTEVQMADGEGGFIYPKKGGYREAYQRLWNSIHEEESWQRNPWVWVVEFRKLEGGAR